MKPDGFLLCCSAARAPWVPVSEGIHLMAPLRIVASCPVHGGWAVSYRPPAVPNGSAADRCSMSGLSGCCEIEMQWWRHVASVGDGDRS